MPIIHITCLPESPGTSQGDDSSGRTTCVSGFQKQDERKEKSPPVTHLFLGVLDAVLEGVGENYLCG